MSKSIRLQLLQSQELWLYTANDHSSHFETVPVQPGKKPRKALNMFGDVLIPPVMKHLFDDGSDKDVQLLSAMSALVCVYLLSRHDTKYLLPDLHEVQLPLRTHS